MIEMKVLITGGAGFIGRWTAKKFLDEGWGVLVLDDLSNGSIENLKEFDGKVNFARGDIKDKKLLEKIFENNFDLCMHIAARINVQDSIDEPRKTFENDVVGTFNVLEQCKKHSTKLVFMSSALVYGQGERINENHPVKPASPYAASKISAENLVMSYHHAYNFPVVIVRPFTVYGPFQKSNMEGGVTSIFIKRFLKGLPLEVFGTGRQTRDLFFVEDCADFLFRAATSDKANGHIINAGSGKDMSINELALFVCKDKNRIKHVPHHHPQAETMKMSCDYSKAKELLGWAPKISLEEGINRTTKWIKGELNRE